MFEKLPRSYQEVVDWEWAQFVPFYHDLLERDLTPATLGAWMSDYSRFVELVVEANTRLSVAYTCDTTNKEIEAKYFAYMERIMVPLQMAGNELDKKLVASGLEPQNFAVPLQQMRTQIEIYREENLPLFVEEEKISSEFQKVIGAQTIQWEGEERTLDSLNPVYQATDRAVREKVWRAAMERRYQDREQIGQMYGKLLELRRQMAANVGTPTYLELRWKQFNRFDYSPQDCETFWNAIEQVVVPAAERLYARRKQRLGVDSLRPWDLDVDADHREALRPFQEIEVLNSKASAIFHQVDPSLGAYFDDMRTRDLLDLANRKGKAPGGYCTFYTQERVPFIFMNAVGIHDNVQTLLHEGGHAFHAYESAKLPYVQQMNAPIEFCEVASMSMELIAAPYLTSDAGGYYTPAEAARARLEHLENLIKFWPYMAVVDSFQHWVYRNLEAAKNPENCNAKWTELWRRFMKGIDWSGLEEHEALGWQRKHHIFTHALYYVEYGLAQLGAVQVWANSLEDQAQAIKDYRQALALGGTASLPDLFGAAGAKFAFDAPTLKKAVDLIEKTIAELEAVH